MKPIETTCTCPECKNIFDATIENGILCSAACPGCACVFTAYSYNYSWTVEISNDSYMVKHNSFTVGAFGCLPYDKLHANIASKAPEMVRLLSDIHQSIITESYSKHCQSLDLKSIENLLDSIFNQ